MYWNVKQIRNVSRQAKGDANKQSANINKQI